MDPKQIEMAVKKAERGIAHYLEIMSLFPTVNVAENRDFQRRFNHFYRIRQRPAAWYTTYYATMQRWKTARASFDDVLDHLHQALGRYEPSFSSKLVATLDADQPVWDAFVLQNTQTRRPSYASKNKIADAKVAYLRIQGWYQQFLASADGRLVVRIFDQNVPEHRKITNVKKVDFVLWQTREQR